MIEKVMLFAKGKWSINILILILFNILNDTF